MPKLILTDEEVASVRECLAILQQAQYDVDRAAQALCSVRGFADEWGSLTKPYESVKAGWHRVHNRLVGLLEARRVADKSYTPTIDEALRNHAEFVDGMTEE